MSQPKTRTTKSKSTQSSQQTSKKIDQTIENAKEKGKQIASEVKEETSKLINETKQETGKIAEQQLQSVAHQINSIASALTTTADNMEDDHSWIADGTRVKHCCPMTKKKSLTYSINTGPYCIFIMA